MNICLSTIIFDKDNYTFENVSQYIRKGRFTTGILKINDNNYEYIIKELDQNNKIWSTKNNGITMIYQSRRFNYKSL
jgi:hypothetical protein